MPVPDSSPTDLSTPIEIVRATWRDTRTLAQLDRRCFKPIDALCLV